MQILINTDTNVDAEPLRQQIENDITSGLARFSDQLTRVEVHLSDQNADRGGGIDMRCMLEARPTGRQPIAVSHSAATTEQAYGGAVQKMRNLLDTSFGRTAARHGRDSIRHPD